MAERCLARLKRRQDGRGAHVHPCAITFSERREAYTTGATFVTPELPLAAVLATGCRLSHSQAVSC